MNRRWWLLTVSERGRHGELVRRTAVVVRDLARTALQHQRLEVALLAQVTLSRRLATPWIAQWTVPSLGLLGVSALRCAVAARDLNRSPLQHQCLELALLAQVSPTLRLATPMTAQWIAKARGKVGALALANAGEAHGRATIASTGPWLTAVSHVLVRPCRRLATLMVAQWTAQEPGLDGVLVLCSAVGAQSPGHSLPQEMRPTVALLAQLLGRTRLAMLTAAERIA